MNKSELKAGFDNITSLYDLADELATTAENSMVKDPEEFITFLEPVINEISEAGEVLTEEYVAVIDEPAKGKTAKSKIEKALRKLFTALDNYRARLQEVATDVIISLSSLVNPVISKLQKQAEKILLLFMQFLDLSLDRIMRKTELDEFKRANSQLLSTMTQQIAH